MAYALRLLEGGSALRVDVLWMQRHLEREDGRAGRRLNLERRRHDLLVGPLQLPRVNHPLRAAVPVNVYLRHGVHLHARHSERSDPDLRQALRTSANSSHGGSALHGSSSIMPILVAL